MTGRKRGRDGMGWWSLWKASFPLIRKIKYFIARAGVKGQSLCGSQ